MVRADILEIARILEEAARCRDLAKFEPTSPLGEDAKVYATLLKTLLRHKDVSAALQTAKFRPLFLVNGLIVAASYRKAPRAVLLQALSIGLLEFADYFELMLDRSAENPPLTPEEAAKQERRFFAYCAAQLIECGMPITGVFATMKGDALDQGAAYELRAWIEEGPKRMLISELLTARERALWGDLFNKGRESWPALRDHLVSAYAIPFRPMPGR